MALNRMNTHNLKYKRIVSVVIVIAFGYEFIKCQIFGLPVHVLDKVLTCFIPTILLLASFLSSKSKSKVFYPIDYFAITVALFTWIMGTILIIDKMFGLRFHW